MQTGGQGEQIKGLAASKDKFTRCYKGRRPQSRRLTASLFISAHEVVKEKRNLHWGQLGQEVWLLAGYRIGLHSCTRLQGQLS
eukprot:486159-Pelagomonas_calceolata.AAC.3